MNNRESRMFLAYVIPAFLAVALAFGSIAADKKNGSRDFLMAAQSTDKSEQTGKIGKEISFNNQKIAFVAFGDIWVMNADGGEQKRLTNHSAEDLHPCWSPDGKKIVFMSYRDDGRAKIYVMNADGSEQKRLTNNPVYDGSPSWSPDGRKITYVSHIDGSPEIYVMNADGSEQKRLINNPAEGLPSWSPDGKKIAYSSWRDGNPEIFVMNADGSKEKRLTFNPAHDVYPSWSPDGKKVAFVSTRDRIEIYVPEIKRKISTRHKNLEIYVMNADGSEQKNLTNNNAIDKYYLWSPDGKKIVFISKKFEDENLGLCVMNADGSEQKSLAYGVADYQHPSWSPDGKKIAFTSLEWQIYVTNADGSGQKRLTDRSGEYPSWSPFLSSTARERNN